MEIIRKLENINDIFSSVVTLGSFDGIHTGHKEIIKTVVNYSKVLKFKSVLITYEPHPRHILNKAKNKLQLLTGLDEKLNMLEKLGLDIVFIIPFTEPFSKISALDFLNTFVLKPFNPKYIIIGLNHHFGKNREGDIKFLKYYCNDNNVVLESVDIVSNSDVCVSSSHIRKLISKGFIRRANFELGRFYGFKGDIKEGNKRGRRIGFPTANVYPLVKNQLMPKVGVYLIKTRISGLNVFGMCNFGIRPTFGEQDFVLEVHLFDDKIGEIYGSLIYVEFLEKIRDEVKFPSESHLISQLKVDRKYCIKLIEKYRQEKN